MFGWFRIPRKVVDGRAQPELVQKAEINEVTARVVVVVRDDAKAQGHRLPDGRVITYEMPDHD